MHSLYLYYAEKEFFKNFSTLPDSSRHKYTTGLRSLEIWNKILVLSQIRYVYVKVIYQVPSCLENSDFASGIHFKEREKPLSDSTGFGFYKKVDV